VVVFDKVRENTRGLLGLTRQTFGQAANLAVNQTLMRSINTSLIALLRPGQRAVIVDDVLATGGTAAATRELVESADVSVAGVVVAIELVALGGRARLDGLSVHALAAL
jgi:preprotein translocase subunit SecF